MAEVIIPAKHQSAPHGAAKAPPASFLRQLQRRVVGVRHYNGRAVRQLHVLTENFTLGVSQAMLDECRETRAGRFLLELLAAVDYAGAQSRPVMLMGRKVKAGGFKLTVVVPINTALQPGAPPAVGASGDGVAREA